MHFTHCVFVEVDPGKDPDKMRRKACLEAVTMTEKYRDIVFDWRIEPDDGDPDYPNGIVLGLSHPEQFKELLLEFSRRPFEVAAEMLGENEVVINRSLIASTWEHRDEWRFMSKLSDLIEILKLIIGEYATESQFYSIPNNSPIISKDILQDALEHPEKYALAFFDYHF